MTFVPSKNTPEGVLVSEVEAEVEGHKKPFKSLSENMTRKLLVGTKDINILPDEGSLICLRLF